MNKMSAPPLQASKKRRLGLMKARIGSRHVIKGPDGVARSCTVREKIRFSKVATTCVCLSCKKTFETEEELIEAHPDTQVMRKQEESHVYAWWSVDPVVKAVEPETKDPKAKAPPIDWGKIVGLLSDEE